MIGIPCSPRAFRLLVPACLLMLVGACAYYNTFFLARKSFSAAEKSVEQGLLNSNARDRDKVPADAERNYEIAVRQSKKVIQRHPGSRWADDAVFVLGASYYGLGEYDSALLSLGQLIETFPKSGYRADAEFLVGMSHFKRREFDQSQLQFEHVLDQYPNFKRRDEILFTQAGTAAGLRREEDAIRRYEALVGEFPKSPRAAESLARIGEIHFEAGRYDSSFIAFRRLGDLAKDDRARLAAAVNEARALIELGRSDEALRLIEDVEPEEAQIVQTPASAPPPQQQDRYQDNEGQNPPGYDPTNMTQEQLLRNQTIQPQTPVRTGMDEEIAQLGLQKAAALNESKRHREAIETLRKLTTRFANTNYAVEAQFQIGYTYETLLDSLESARTAYERAAGMSSQSIFRDQAAARSKALQSQIELEQKAGAEDTLMEERASAALRLAEILLLDRDLVDESVAKYREVEGQFPESKSAPRAAYALAYIRWKRMGDSLGAQGDFRDLVGRYPASRQARGAISLLASQHADTSGLGGLLLAMAVDTVAVAERTGSPAGIDTLGMPVDSLVTPTDSLSAPVDSLGGPDGMPGMSPLIRGRRMGEDDAVHRRGGPGRRGMMPPDPYGREPVPVPGVPDTADAGSRSPRADTTTVPPVPPDTVNVPLAPGDSAAAPFPPDTLRVPVPAPADTADTSGTGERP